MRARCGPAGISQAQLRPSILALTYYRQPAYFTQNYREDLELQVLLGSYKSNKAGQLCVYTHNIESLIRTICESEGGYAVVAITFCLEHSRKAYLFECPVYIR